MVTLTDEEKGELVDALLGARSILLEPGVWTQHSGATRPWVESSFQPGEAMYRRSTGVLDPRADQFCLAGAVARATNRNMTGHPVLRYLNSFLRARGHRRSVQRWNDYPGRTVEQVIGLVDLALKELKG